MSLGRKISIKLSHTSLMFKTMFIGSCLAKNQGTAGLYAHLSQHQLPSCCTHI